MENSIVLSFDGIRNRGLLLKINGILNFKKLRDSRLKSNGLLQNFISGARNTVELTHDKKNMVQFMKSMK